MLVVARACLLGNGTPLDKKRAEYWYRQVANAGSVFGHQCLGRLYVQEKRYAEAKPEFEFGAARGSPVARLALGKLYFLGWGVEKDHDRARRYYEQAIDRGSVIAKAYLARMRIQEGSSLLEKARGIINFMSALFEAIRIGHRNGLDDERLLRW